MKESCIFVRNNIENNEKNLYSALCRADMRKWHHEPLGAIINGQNRHTRLLCLHPDASGAGNTTYQQRKGIRCKTGFGCIV